MNRRYVHILLCAVALSGCGGEVRFVNGVTDSTGMTAQSSNLTFPEQVPFGSASTIVPASKGSYTVQFTGGSTTQPSSALTVTVDNVNVAAHSITTVLTDGNFDNGTARGFVAEQSLDKPGTGVELQPLNAAYDASQTYPSLTFIIRSVNSTSDGTALKTPLGKATTLMKLDAGTYELLVAQDDCGFNGNTCSRSPVLFDSGPNGIALPTEDGSNLFQVAILDAPGQPAGSVVSLLLLNSSGARVALFNGGH